MELGGARKARRIVAGGVAASLPDEVLDHGALNRAEDLGEPGDPARELARVAFGDLPANRLDQDRLKRGEVARHQGRRCLLGAKVADLPGVAKLGRAELAVRGHSRLRKRAEY